MKILEELNIKDLSFIDDSSQLVSEKLKLNYSVLGKKYGKTVKAIQEYVDANDSGGFAALLRSGERIEIGDILYNGSPVTLSIEEVMIESVERADIAAADDGPHKVALDTLLTTELIEEGIAREFVRVIQNLRKEKDFEVTDTISIGYSAPDSVCRAIGAFTEYIKKETLARSLSSNGEREEAEKRKVGGDEIFVFIEKMN